MKKNFMLACSPVAVRHITLRDNKGLLKDHQCERIFEALAEIDFADIILTKLNEHKIQAKGLTIDVSNGIILESHPN